MPDLGQLALLAGIGIVAAAAIGWPLLRRDGPGPSPAAGSRAAAEARALRHRVALDALLDVEADRRAGSLDDASYRREREEAEEHAAQTLAEVGEEVAPSAAARGGDEPSRGRRVAGLLGAVLAAGLLVGFVLPAPAGLGERTIVNQALAGELARESARQADIQRLLTALAADQKNPQVLSDLADAYLAGSSAEDLQRAAVALQVLLAVEPQNRSAYRRLVTAYITAGDWTDARAATDAYAGIVTDDEPDVPFFRGLIAFRSGDAAGAVKEFDRFLQLAPGDGRAAMVKSLLAEAAGRLPSPTGAPGG